MISLHEVAVRQGTFALVGITFEVPTGEYAVLMGRTGSGKTTLLEVICGLKPVAAGAIRLHGRDVTRLQPAGRRIGYVPQDRALFATMSVREHLAFALELRRTDRQTIENRVEELAHLLGLESLLRRHPHGLSGGEAQRVALGRALAMRPEVLLLDEPLSALDEETREEMYDLLRAVRKQTGVTVLHVTHSRSEAEVLADRVFGLDGGKVLQVC